LKRLGIRDARAARVMKPDPASQPAPLVQPEIPLASASLVRDIA
jgi:hypothetical protein